MNVAWIALIVAVCSLLWNVISTLVSWRRSRPRVQFDTRGILDDFSRATGKGSVSAQVIALNVGGTAVEVLSLGVWTRPFPDEAYFGTLFRERSWRGRSKIRRAVSRLPFLGPRFASYGSYLLADGNALLQQQEWLTGAELPLTLAPGHSVKWMIDVPRLIMNRRAAQLPTEVHAYIDLGTGQRVWCSLRLNENSFDRAWDVLERRARAGEIRSLPPWPTHRPDGHGLREEPSTDVQHLVSREGARD